MAGSLRRVPVLTSQSARACIRTSNRQRSLSTISVFMIYDESASPSPQFRADGEQLRSIGRLVDELTDRGVRTKVRQLKTVGWLAVYRSIRVRSPPCSRTHSILAKSLREVFFMKGNTRGLSTRPSGPKSSPTSPVIANAARLVRRSSSQSAHGHSHQPRWRPDDANVHHQRQSASSLLRHSTQTRRRPQGSVAGSGQGD